MTLFKTSSEAAQVLFALVILLTGIGLGAAFTLFPATVGDTYGAVNFGICILLSASAASTSLLSFARFLDSLCFTRDVVFGLVQFGSAGASFLTPVIASAVTSAFVRSWRVASGEWLTLEADRLLFRCSDRTMRRFASRLRHCTSSRRLPCTILTGESSEYGRLRTRPCPRPWPCERRCCVLVRRFFVMFCPVSLTVLGK